MESEGDALARWLNAHSRSRIGLWVRVFANPHHTKVAPHLPAYGVFTRLRAIPHETVLGLARHPKRLRRGKPLDLTKPFSVRFRLLPPIQTDNGYDVRVLPVTEENAATLLLVLLASARQVHRVRICGWAKCGNWFFARKETQNFCSSNCRKRDYESRQDPELMRTRRAEKMREYRARLKANPNLIVRENQPKKGKRQ